MKTSPGSKRCLSAVLDCDGVILDSNGLKSAAFVESVWDYPEAQRRAFLVYHQSHGGVSRYVKFEHFLRVIVGHCSRDRLEELLGRYQARMTGLSSVPLCEGAEAFLTEAAGLGDVVVVSGGDEAELRLLLRERGLDQYLSEIRGSPLSKGAILEDLARRYDLRGVLYVGDSRLDHEGAAAHGMRFCFAYGYTEFGDWRSYCEAAGLPCCRDLGKAIPWLPARASVKVR